MQFPTQLGDYILEGKLGQGRFGAVYVAHKPEEYDRVVIKMVDVSNHDGRMNAEREIAALSAMSHSNIVRLYDTFDVFSEEGTHQLAIVMERADRGDLFHLIMSRGRLSEELSRHLFQQLVDALLHCNEHNFVHRDLKPENILLDRYLNIKLADFGLSSKYDPSGKSRLVESCGSVEYASPEILQGRSYKGPEVDVFSLGLVLFAMLTGRRPFGGKAPLHVLNSMFRGGPLQFPSHLSAGAVSLLRGMLKVRDEERLTLEEIKNHAWLKPVKAEVVMIEKPLKTRFNQTIWLKEIAVGEC